jgi:probable phosphoglycerate mutase
VDSELLQGFYLKNVWVELLDGEVRSHGQSAHLRVGRRAALLLAAGFFVWLAAARISSADDALVVYLVRHAEKAENGSDPALDPEGVERAAALAAMLRDAGITAVHSTDFRRTRDTAAPLADHLGLEVREYHWEALGTLAAGMQREGGRHLVVGHSDTTPELVGLLGGEPGPPIDEPTEYDRLYVVTIGPDGTVTTVLLRYGNL